MGRRRTMTRGKKVAFSTRHMRTEHRDKLRVLGDLMGLNMEEALDLALHLGLRRMEKKAVEKERETHDADPTAW